MEFRQQFEEKYDQKFSVNEEVFLLIKLDRIIRILYKFIH